ncbi:hypothetical protein SAMN03159343_3322 [Klenkia marina]|uniref:Uncharacterized protein n=1 Tax=Klenkia marina TaxID=1960309 RepID=A0A1G4YQ82_9ACTN|nr:hypothetical protein [Klenkia marina]SCX55583.1 hypothetical protein SAMN03159343_3322 [Klenkia marina]
MTDRLVVRADLEVVVGAVTARLTGDGSDLVLAATDPLALWRAVVGTPWPAGATLRPGRAAVGRLGTDLARHGLHLDVTGPQGRVVELGAGVSSPVGRALTGSPAVRPGTPRTVAATVAATSGAGRRPALRVCWAAAALAAVLWAVRRRR